jgi:hypothetical protein
VDKETRPDCAIVVRFTLMLALVGSLVGRRLWGVGRGAKVTVVSAQSVRIVH